jgi:regulator of protease activity HflC (stomatin/prohibitin superfamily)
MSLVYTVTQSHCYVVERFGKFSRVQNQGLRMKLPFIEVIKQVPYWTSAVKPGGLIELTEQQMNTAPRACHTKDNVEVKANASVYWRIIDPVKAVYEVDNLPSAVSDISLNALRAIIGTMSLNEVFSNRQKISERIAAELHQTADKWGIQFSRVEIQDLDVEEDTRLAMQQEMDADRGKKAKIAQAEAAAFSIKALAEADKSSAILRAEGEAIALAKVAEAERMYLEQITIAVGKDAAANMLIADKYLRSMGVISKNPADKVFIPNSFQALLSLPTDSKVN